jgi:hypothetical protein
VEASDPLPLKFSPRLPCFPMHTDRRLCRKWGVGRPSDAVCIADLQTNHRFTAPAAKSFLQVFDEAMWFLGGGATGVFAAIPQSISPVFPPFSRVKIGDFVQTPTDTANQSAAPRRVVWLADGGRYLYVERSLTRYPAQAVTKIEESPTRFPPIQSNKPPAVKPASETSSDSEGGDWFSFPSIGASSGTRLHPGSRQCGRPRMGFDHRCRKPLVWKASSSGGDRNRRRSVRFWLG